MNTRVAQREGERVGLEQRAALSSEAAAHAQVEPVKQLQLDLHRTAEELALDSEEFRSRGLRQELSDLKKKVDRTAAGV